MRSDRRDWIVIAALTLSMWSCHRANVAYDLAEQAEDQGDAAEIRARHAGDTADQAEADIIEIKDRLRMD